MLCHLSDKEYLESSRDPTKPQQSHLTEFQGLLHTSCYYTRRFNLVQFHHVFFQSGHGFRSVLVTLGNKTDKREHCYTISGNYCFEASLQTQSFYKHINHGNTNLKCQETSNLIGSRMSKHLDVWGSSMFWLDLRGNKGLHDYVLTTFMSSLELKHYGFFFCHAEERSQSSLERHERE